MAELYQQAKKILTAGAAIEALSSQPERAGFSATKSAVDYALPVVIDALNNRAADSTGIVELLNRLRALDTTGLGTASMWSPASARAAHADRCAESLFDGGAGRPALAAATERLVQRSRVPSSVAESVLGTCTWTVCGLLKQLYGPAVDRHTMEAVFRQERRDLSVDGWDPWLRSVEVERSNAFDTTSRVPRIDSAPSLGSTAGVASVPGPASPDGETEPRLGVDTTRIDSDTPMAAPAMASDPRAARYPPPVRRPGRESTPRPPSPGPHTERPARPAPPPRPDVPGVRGPNRYGGFDDTGSYGDPTYGDAGYGGEEPTGRPSGGRDGVPPPVNRRRSAVERPQPARHRPLNQPTGPVMAGHTRPKAAAQSSPRRWWPVLLGLLTVLGIAAAIYYFMGRSGDETATSSNDEAAAIADPSTESQTDTGDPAADSASDEAAADTSAEPAAPAISETTKVAMDVPMVDIFSGSDADGVMSLEFFPFSGEVCYEVTTTGLNNPYDGHIHTGEIEEKGGIVVDFGELSDGSTGCIENEPNDIQAIMADPTAYYAEMHDRSFGGVDVRGQISAGTDVSDPENVLGRAVAESEGPSNIDPDGNGAQIEISSDSIALVGAVADEATAQQVRDTLAGIDLGGIPLDDQLTIEPGAPLPSGRIVVSDAIFFGVGSSVLGDADAPVLDLLARIFAARPTWSMTVVGHTDSTGNDVINLELSLERADSVRTALVDRGADSMLIKIRGAGSTEPRGDNSTEEGRSENRRIEFEIDAG